jgi:hypothetical protein
MDFSLLPFTIAYLSETFAQDESSLCGKFCVEDVHQHFAVFNFPLEQAREDDNECAKILADGNRNFPMAPPRSIRRQFGIHALFVRCHSPANWVRPRLRKSRCSQDDRGAQFVAMIKR